MPMSQAVRLCPELIIRRVTGESPDEFRQRHTA